MTLRDVGKRGEGILQSWASEEDASLTKTDDDRWGWDFLLEFPIQRTSVGAEPDKEEEVYRCLIQVKSTSSSDRSCQVKMSNWRRLVETPLPAFFLVLFRKTFYPTGSQHFVIIYRQIIGIRIPINHGTHRVGHYFVHVYYNSFHSQ